MRPLQRGVCAVAALAALLAAGSHSRAAPAQAPAPPPAVPAFPESPGPLANPVSLALGVPWCGRLVGGRALAAGSSYFFTWELPTARRPSPAWRRHGTARLLALVRAVAKEDRRAHPRGPRLGIGDLSLPRGGPFGPRYGGPGHLSHQNGLDVDVLYPRRDGIEAPATARREVDRPRSAQLVRRFVAAGAQRVFVGFGLGLRGPRGIVSHLPHHLDHMHVRRARASRARPGPLPATANLIRLPS